MAASCRRLNLDQINALFFDMDNTIIPTRQGDKNACNKVSNDLVEKYQIPQKVANKVTNSFLKSFRKCPEQENACLDDWRIYLWQQALGIEYASIADEVYRIWLEYRYEQLRPTDHILSLVNCLKTRYYVALITNGPSSSQWEKIHRLNLAEHFHLIIVSGDLRDPTWAKPHKAIFMMACDALRVAPERCIMVGDRLDTDIAGAKRAGFAASVWLTQQAEVDGTQLDAVPDFVIRDLGELASVFLTPLRPTLSQYLDLSEPESDNSNSCSNVILMRHASDEDDAVFSNAR